MCPWVKEITYSWLNAGHIVSTGDLSLKRPVMNQNIFHIWRLEGKPEKATEDRSET